MKSMATAITNNHPHMTYHPDEKISKAIEFCLGDDEEVLLADGFESAFLGIARQFGKPFAVYDQHECIRQLAESMSIEEAEEYFSYNVEGAWVGENTPAFIELVSLL
jgi:hypothetical protein